MAGLLEGSATPNRAILQAHGPSLEWREHVARAAQSAKLKTSISRSQELIVGARDPKPCEDTLVVALYAHDRHFSSARCPQAILEKRRSTQVRSCVPAYHIQRPAPLLYCYGIEFSDKCDGCQTDKEAKKTAALRRMQEPWQGPSRLMPVPHILYCCNC